MLFMLNSHKVYKLNKLNKLNSALLTLKIATCL
jgi:hypothetical protein